MFWKQEVKNNCIFRLKRIPLQKTTDMEPVKFKQISVDDLYVSIIVAKKATDERGWTGMEPVEKKVISTGNVVMDAIGRLLAADCSLRPADLAQLLGTNRIVVNGMFCLFTGMMTEDFLMAYRIKRLKEWLAYTDVSTKEAALRSGFASEAVVGRLFQKRLKTTPGKYRKRYQPKNVRELYQWAE